MSANSREAEKIEIAASAANNEVNLNEPSIESSAPAQAAPNPTKLSRRGFLRFAGGGGFMAAVAAAISSTFSNRAQAQTWQKLNPTIFRTADVTPVLVTGGQLTSATHSLGVVPSIVILEYVNLIAEQGYVAGDVVQPTTQWTGTGRIPMPMWKNTTTVGVQCTATYIICMYNKTTGATFTPTAANWAYRFIIMK